jgi:hypothetical protein
VIGLFSEKNIFMSYQANCWHIVGDELRKGIPFYAGHIDSKHRCFVGFDTTELNFGGAYAAGFNLFPGGEWHRERPWWYKGKNPNGKRSRRLLRDKWEIWAINFWRKIAVADRSNGLRFLEVKPSGPELIVPEPEEVITYLHERETAMRLRANQRGLDWVRASLSAIFRSG